MSFSNALSVGAFVVSAVALVFTGLQWRESHNQLLLSMKPSVDFDTETDSDDLPVGIIIENAGPGPAVIKSIIYYMDKKVIGDVDKLADFANLESPTTFYFEEGDTLAVGEHQWLLSYKKRPHAKKEEKELNDFVELLDHHLAAEVQFCPAIPGECSTKCSIKGWCR